MLSATIITFNEEHNIRECIQSLNVVADEIIVVDSHSTDQTREICAEFDQVRCIEQQFLGHIEQKNLAISFTKYDMVISLDADERLSEKLQFRILKEKKNGFPFLAYQMPRLNNYCGKWIRFGGWYPDTKIRVWNKHIGSWGGENPHDKVILKQGTEVRNFKYPILHFSFRTVEEHIQQINKFSTIAANSMYKKGKKVNLSSPAIKSAFRFFRDYVIKLGCLDGAIGFQIAKRNAQAVYLRYQKLLNLYQNPPA